MQLLLLLLLTATVANAGTAAPTTMIPTAAPTTEVPTAAPTTNAPTTSPPDNSNTAIILTLSVVGGLLLLALIIGACIGCRQPMSGSTAYMAGQMPVGQQQLLPVTTGPRTGVMYSRAYDYGPVKEH